MAALRLALACCLALLACVHARSMFAEAPAPIPAAEPATAATLPAILVAYADAGCLGSANLSAADADLPYFGGEEPASGAASWLFLRVGMAPDAPAICKAIESQLVTPCTSGFLALRAAGSDQIFLQPSVDVSVGASSAGCQISHCQGGVATVAGGAASGTFLQRTNGEPTYNVTLSALGNGQVAVSTGTPVGDCPLVYEGVDASELLA